MFAILTISLKAVILVHNVLTENAHGNGERGPLGTSLWVMSRPGTTHGAHTYILVTR